jgi:nanoRNase/pAp phosphatase (c-di-AMP/oligoRNAs hydrolase)
MRGALPPPVADAVGAVERAFAQNPVVVVLAAAGAAVLVGALGWRLWLARRPPGATLRRRLAATDAVAVLMHPDPDPDAMACALGVARIAEQAGTEATVQYPGRIRHHENRAFRTVLDLDLDRVESAAGLAADAVVLVDHNAPRGFDGADGVSPFAVVDHHPGGGEGSAFTDVRPDRGSCASIVTEYFDQIGARRFGPDDDVPDDPEEPVLTSDVATGLMYGVLSDTKNLTRGCSGAEFDASAYLSPAVDEDRLDRIAHPQVDAESLDTKARAITDRETRPPYAVSDVGTVNNRDAIPQAADELRQLEGIASVVVLGDDDGTIHLSGRSRDDRVHMGRALAAAVDDIPMANAGGHARMGGGQVSVAHMEGIGPGEGLTRQEFRERLFEAMAEEIEPATGQ